MPAMLCRKPFVTPSGTAYGCGQCGPCRYNRRRIWVHRIMLEAAQYEHNAFVTLTYSDECLPEDMSLRPKDTQDFLKRLRSRVSPSRFRYYLVGEYGDATWRPHYHAALFGFRSCNYGQSRYSKSRRDCCYWCDLVRDTWGSGNVFLGSLEDDSAGYLAGYVVKKMTAKDDPRLEGRHPEFGRMSLRPGIGRDALFEIADSLMKYELDLVMSDVPSAMRHGVKQLPLGRYLRRNLRRMVGKDEAAPQATIDEIQKEMLPLRLAAKASSSEPSVTSHILRSSEGKYRQFEGKSRLYKRRKSL